MLIALALASAFPSHPPRCRQYRGASFTGTIRGLRLRRSAPHAWSAEDADCDRLFFPVTLVKAMPPATAATLTRAIEAKRGDDPVTVNARVRIKMYADHSGGEVTILGVER